MGIFSRLRPEQRSISWQQFDMLSPLSHIFSGLQASSGAVVSRETAITLSPYWRALNLISNDLAKLRIHVFQHDGQDKTRDIEHPAHNLLTWEANDEACAFTFRQTLQAQALSEGNGYAYIERNGAGGPLQLWPLDARRTWPVRYNGVLSYVSETIVDEQGDFVPATPYGDNNNWQQVPVAAENMIHIRGLGFDGLVGHRVLDLAKEVLGLGIVQRQHESAFFGNNTTPRGVLEFPGALAPATKAELIRTWNEVHQGAGKAHKTAVLDRGMKFNAISLSAADAQLIQSKEFNILEIANITGIPPHKLGHTARSSFSSLESENQSYLDNCLSHWIVAWQQELRKKLLTEEQKASHSYTIDFDWADLVRADTSQRMAAHQTAILSGFKNRDEARNEEGYNAIPGGLGKKFFIPQNVAIAGETPPAGAPGSGQPSPPKPAGPAALANFSNPFEALAAPSPASMKVRSASRTVIYDAIRRTFKRVGQHASRAAKDGKGFMTWLDGMEAEHRDAVDEILTPGLELAMAAGEVKPTAAIGYSRTLLSWAKEQLLEVAGNSTATELEKRVASYFTELEKRCGGPGSGVPGPCPLENKGTTDADAKSSRTTFGEKANLAEKSTSAFVKSQLDAVASGQPPDSQKAAQMEQKAEKSYKNSVIRSMNEMGSQIAAKYGAAALNDPIWTTMKNLAKDSVSNFSAAVHAANALPSYVQSTGNKSPESLFNDRRQDMKSVIQGHMNMMKNAWEALKTKYGS